MIDLNKVPYAIKHIFDSISNLDKEAVLYGECLLDLLVNKEQITGYSILTSSPIESLLASLEIQYEPSETRVRKGVMLSFSQEKGYGLVIDDLLTEKTDPSIIYINILTTQKPIETKLKSFFIPIERFGFDLKRYYFADDIQKIIRTKEIVLSAEDKTNISSNLLSLFNLAFYVAKFSLCNTEKVEPNIATSYKRLYPKHSWRKAILSLMALDKPSIAFELMREWNFLHLFFNELMEGYNVSQNEYHKYDVYYHSLNACDAASKDSPLIRFAALLHDIGKPRAKQKKNGDKDVFYDHENIGSRMSYFILRRLGFSYDNARRVSNLVSLHMFHYTPYWTDKAVRRFLRKADNELPNLLDLRKADRVGSGTKKAYSSAIDNLLKRIRKVDYEDSLFKPKDLNIDGFDIMRHFDLVEGPIVGKLLGYLVNLVSGSNISNDKEILLEHAKEYLASTGMAVRK